MSLDVDLMMPGISATGSGIFIRENGGMREISRAEWDEKFPGREPVVFEGDGDRSIYSANITHNLGKMASEAGIYQALWRPEEIGITRAFQLIEPLRSGLERLRQQPDHFKQFNPENGWGDYDGLVRFVEQYLEACEDYQTAVVSVSR
jgi:hypothetical protein